MQVSPFFHSKTALNASKRAEQKQKCVPSLSWQCSDVSFVIQGFLYAGLTTKWCKEKLITRISQSSIFFSQIASSWVSTTFSNIFVSWPEVKPHTSIGAESTLFLLFDVLANLCFSFYGLWFWQSVHTKSIKCTQILQRQRSSTSTELAARGSLLICAFVTPFECFWLFPVRLDCHCVCSLFAPLINPNYDHFNSVTGLCVSCVCSPSNKPNFNISYQCFLLMFVWPFHYFKCFVDWKNVNVFLLD